MEENYKPLVQPQRHLNPAIKEVVRKEVLKLLDIGMIYPISDSNWVSPVQIVLKKGAITVVKNNNNELIPLGQSQGGECVWTIGNLILQPVRIIFHYLSRPNIRETCGSCILLISRWVFKV